MEAAANANPSNVQVQHVTKKSSDELLRKFAELEDDAAHKCSARKELRVVVVKRRKTARRRESGGYSQCESPSGNESSTSLVERKWLLPPAATRRSTLLRQLGVGRSHLRAREIKSRSLFGTIEKTWRKTIGGASKIFMEKHYNRHRRLINDVV
ncbi:uncharacterized protein LOC111311574 [Durio zibethinus]|uniref:Uncharacterized protein LOC111311574 n=1 Tax=Durio zibethinus TaxID=66656 RepID=A0A6P6APJ3_DURZI|nr:uncharacterized protein LOC111311574 [Durio zibethinus]